MGGGKLVFKGERDKGDKKKKKKKNKEEKKEKKTKRHHDDGEEDGDHDDDSSGQRPSASSSAVAAVAAVRATATAATATATAPTPVPKIHKGTGTVTVSGTVVTGYGTKFGKEIHPGDAILVNSEMRVVTMRLSDISCNLSSAFTSPKTLEMVKHPTPFQYIPKPKTHATIQNDLQRQQLSQFEQQQEIARHAFGTYGSGGGTGSSAAGGAAAAAELVYRERTEHGSYRIKRQRIDGAAEVTRTDLLEMRTKKKSDKYC